MLEGRAVTNDDLDDMSEDALRDLARRLGVSSWWAADREQLLRFIRRRRAARSASEALSDIFKHSPSDKREGE
jgi:hypothetical protein